jgi:hypothetical protein
VELIKVYGSNGSHFLVGHQMVFVQQHRFRKLESAV